MRPPLFPKMYVAPAAKARREGAISAPDGVVASSRHSVQTAVERDDLHSL